MGAPWDEAQRPVAEELYKLRARGTLTRYFVRLQGPNKGRWYLSGPGISARAVPFDYVQGFIAGTKV
jgi:hypothetical protein